MNVDQFGENLGFEGLAGIDDRLLFLRTLLFDSAHRGREVVMGAYRALLSA